MAARGNDQHDLTRALALIRAEYAGALTARFQTSDQNLYGFVLVDVILLGSISAAGTDPGRFTALADRVWPYVGDLDWDGVMEEDQGGAAEIVIGLHRPRLRYSLTRGPITNYRSHRYATKQARDEKAREHADRDGQPVMLFEWSQGSALACDPVDFGETMQGIVEPAEGRALAPEPQPQPPRITAIRHEVRRLRDELAEVVSDLDTVAGVEIFDETSAVAIRTRDGYRWLVYVARPDPEGKGRLTVTLLSPQLRTVTGLPVMALSGTAQVRDVLLWAKRTTIPANEDVGPEALRELKATVIDPGT